MAQPAARTVVHGTVTLTEAAYPVAAPAQFRGRSPPGPRAPKPRGTVARVPNVPKDFIRNSSPPEATAAKSKDRKCSPSKATVV